MDRSGLVRLLSLYLPIAAGFVLVAVRKPPARQATGAGFALAWNLGALFVLHLAAMRTGWWRFDAEGGLFLGFPVDLYLGWALFWGPVASLAFPRLNLALVSALMLGLDVLLMPLCRPVVVLGNAWMIGEAFALVLVLLPGQLLSRWTAENRRLDARSTLLVVAFAILSLGVLPAAVLVRTGGSISSLSSRPPWVESLLLQVLVVFAVPGVSAVMEFATRGNGTPFPYDPPTRLVTSGIYSYVANPMQVSICLVIAVWGVVLGSGWVAAGSLLVLAYGAGFAAWHEDEQLRKRFGDSWVEYRLHVRPWKPRLRPHVALPARLYVAETCAPCRAVGNWLRKRSLTGLVILAAENHPSRALTRITYAPGDGGNAESGVSALARALEHLHLGWALLGESVRLPGILQLAQLIVDAVGGGPRSLAPSKTRGACAMAGDEGPKS